ncbi:YfbK domain-containing protein [Cerasicoccus fimbriatus]|uniref:YfbK domain-containing protein n=1 Tax=Cerasicoccus fimbriatus TaxID=3014554 RepID=UPI0022B48C71|nr:von Willebrand factor type A domain-containing protein [Cerasicoccus sp. TK19100]
MNFDPNDPRLTAYALGEPLDADAENFVREHRDDPDFQAAVEEIRQTAKLLESAFGAEADSATAVDEKAILERAKPTPPNRVMLFLRSSPVMAIAATLVLMGLVAIGSWWTLREPEPTATVTIQIERPDRLDEPVLVASENFNAQLNILGSEKLAENVAHRLTLEQLKQLSGNDLLSDGWVASAATEIMKRTSLDTQRESYLIDINVRHPDEQLAATLANLLADEYLNYSIKLNIETSMRAVEDLRARADQQRLKVEELRADVSVYRNKFKRLGFSSEELGAKQQSLVEAESAYAELQGQLQTEKAKVALTSAGARIVNQASSEGPIALADVAMPGATVNGIKKPVAQNIPAPKPPPPNADSREAMLKEVSRSWSRPQIMPAEGSNLSRISGDVGVDKKASTPPGATANEQGALFAYDATNDARRDWSDQQGTNLTGFVYAAPGPGEVQTKRRNRVLPSRLEEVQAVIPGEQQWNREGYDLIKDNEFTSPGVEPLSTFSIDVDTASYANVRRMLRGGQLPPPDAVRIEEMINYFDYDYPIPAGEGHPFSVTTEVAPAPWSPQHYLVRIGLKGYEMPWEERPSSNLVFLIDVSGSMNNANKLGLVKQALTGLTQRLDRRDRVAIVVYAGSSGLALPSTTADNQETIQHALANLKAGGSTNGGEGIELAYQVAQEKFIEGGNNRVILCTDGDFNVGVSDRGQLTRLIEDKAKSGVFLSICGFGMGNLKDDMMESLSNAGNGNYAYIDTIREARKVFGQDLAGTMLTIAKDVKIQVEFNPANVAAYRLIGYENRMLAAKDFNDDTKDAGEIGAGHTVTALYEIVPVGVDSPALPQDSVDALKYQEAPVASESENVFGDEWLTVKLRYKQPDGDTSTLLSTVVDGPSEALAVSSDLQFASSVVEFGLLLRDSPHAGNANWAGLIERARQTIGTDPGGHRAEFVELAKAAQELSAQQAAE